MVYVIRTLEEKNVILFIHLPTTGGPVSVPANKVAIDHAVNVGNVEPHGVTLFERFATH